MYTYANGCRWHTNDIASVLPISLGFQKQQTSNPHPIVMKLLYDLSDRQGPCVSPTKQRYCTDADQEAE